MTEAQWQRCSQPGSMLTFLGKRASARKLRLFACGCCRRIWHCLGVERCRHAVEVAERYADGQASEDELLEAAEAAEQAAAELELTWRKGWNAARTAALAAALDARAAADRAVATVADGDTVREVFGNPFRSVAVDGAWLTWGGATVLHLAESIYQERRFGDLPILADALEESGCGEEVVLDHCRSGELHMRGCWVVDLLLDKR